MTKSEVIRLRITPKLKEWIAKEASRQNRTMSNFLENLILQEAEKHERENRKNEE